MSLDVFRLLGSFYEDTMMVRTHPPGSTHWRSAAWQRRDSIVIA